MKGMCSKIFHDVFGISVEKKYTGQVLRKKVGQRGHFLLPKNEDLPKRMTVDRPKYIDCIEKSSDAADDVYTQKIAVKYISKRVGYGVFAKEDIPSGVVGIYTGELKKVSRYAESRYLFSFITKALNNIMIDGEKKGNWTSFINHNSSESKKTNLVVKEYFYKGLPYIIFWAPKKIKKGSQLLYDYGESYWETLGIKPKPL